MSHRNTFILTLAMISTSAAEAPEHVERFRGKMGPTGWRCNVIQADSEDHGPDGINLHDWDGDGDLDLFSNAEEGKFSRLYFNPGIGKVRGCWDEFIEFRHGKCEDSGIGDLDNDGDIDYIANGGWVFFNPGKRKVRDRTAWSKMVLFNDERRVPIVSDVDGDGLDDLIVGAQEWYKQPNDGKHDSSKWLRFSVGKNRWPMNCILCDVDKDGDSDWVVPDRGKEICWYENPGGDRIFEPWQRKTLHRHSEPMFMDVADLDGDGVEDFIITGGSKGEKAKQLLILMRTNSRGDPQFKEITIDQPSGIFPKGVAVFDIDNNSKTIDILVTPKGGNIWTASCAVDPFVASNWEATPIEIPGSTTRKKMDNAWVGDIDGDGDLDVATTEENGGWGVIWFENPLK